MKAAFFIAIALTLFVIWRYTSVRRGASSRDETLLKRLDPVAARLERKDRVGTREIADLCRAPELRLLVYRMLSHYDRLEDFPREALGRESQAEAILAVWLSHPNELQAAPVAMEMIERVEHAYGRDIAEFYVFRYRMPEDHWAGTGWLLGLSGPFFPSEKPYESVAGGFSRAGDTLGSVAPQDLVSWYADMHFKKFRRDA